MKKQRNLVQLVAMIAILKQVLMINRTNRRIMHFLASIIVPDEYWQMMIMIINIIIILSHATIIDTVQVKLGFWHLSCSIWLLIEITIKDQCSGAGKNDESSEWKMHSNRIIHCRQMNLSFLLSHFFSQLYCCSSLLVCLATFFMAKLRNNKRIIWSIIKNKAGEKLLLPLFYWLVSNEVIVVPFGRPICCCSLLTVWLFGWLISLWRQKPTYQ